MIYNEVVQEVLRRLRPDTPDWFAWNNSEEPNSWENAVSNVEGVIKPTKEEYDAEYANYDAQEYARLRKAEYDTLNQYEMMFDDQVNGTTTWVDAINAIKAKYPKGGS